MNISILSLTLTNFKCFQSKEFTFDSNVTTIKGRNGEGKTTIADAILFCLFGKDTKGQSDLEIFKTIDRETKKPIPHLDHSVEMVISILKENEEGGSNHIVTLKRSIKEDWVKKRGASETVFKNNKQEFTINGEDTTPTDYKKYIESLANEKTFRAITNPTEFLSWHWKDQRTFLTEMVGSVDPETFATSDNLKALLKVLRDTGEDIEAYLKHLGYQAKGIKEKLERIPIRLEEQNKALPEPLDCAALEEEYKILIAQLSDIDQKIYTIKSGNGQDVRKEELRKQLDEAYEQLRKRKDVLESKVREDNNRLATEIQKHSQKFTSLLNDQRDIESSLQSHVTLIEKCNETLEQCEKDAQAIRKDWAANNALKLEWEEKDNICPTCGQYLPQELLQEKQMAAQADINKHKAEVKAELTAKAEKVKKLRADTEKQIEEYKEKKVEFEQKLTDVKNFINEVFSEKQKLEKEKASLPTYDTLRVSDEEVKAIEAKIEQINQQMGNICVTSEEDTKALEELTAKRLAIGEEADSLNKKLATKAQYDKILSLIDGIKAEEKDLIKQLSELEMKEHGAREYQTKQNTILEDRINSHFKVVQWKLFQTVNNGGDSYEQPYCECYVDGIPYRTNLNQAARLNGGLDVINTLCQAFDIAAPICIDNAESTINIIETAGQQIRLFVDDCELKSM